MRSDPKFRDQWSVREPLEVKREVFTMRRWSRACPQMALIIVLAAACGAAVVFLAPYLARGSRDKRFDTKVHVSRLLREFWATPPEKLSSCWRRAQEQPQLSGPENKTNRGAEYLYFISREGMIMWESDTDHDGLQEAADAWGDPLIVLWDEFTEDRIVNRHGTEAAQTVPPYYGHGIYINSVMLNTWIYGDQEALTEMHELDWQANACREWERAPETAEPE